jgi:Mg2+ and Co2+ transporter CorA
MLSRDDGSDVTADLRTWRPRGIRDSELLWIDVRAPTDDERSLVGSALSLDAKTIEALNNTVATPDGHVLRDGLLVTVHTLRDDLTESPCALHILIGQGWVMTWHADPMAFLDEHFERVQDQREVGRLTPVLLLVAMLDWHLDTFFAAAEELEREVDELDEAALRGDDKDMLDRLVAMRRRIALVRRLLSANRDMYSEVSRPDFMPEVDAREAAALDALTHRLERATEAVANAREMLIGTFDVHMTRTAQRTNDIMRLLTWVSVTLLPAGVLAGVMGMNFQVGLFENSGLFWVIIAAMILFALTTLIAARRRGWL